MATRVLRELADGWLECEDGQGVFYHNSVTKESTEAMPPNLASNQALSNQVKVLRELPGTWLECEDANGIFYFNQVTQQSADTLPVEAMNYPTTTPAPAPVPAASGNFKMLQQMGGNWLKCQDDQGIFYLNSLTKQTSIDLPAELNVATTPYQGAPTTQPKILQELPNNWQKCQDDQGIFYFNKATQQTSIDPPAGLNAASTPYQGAPTSQPKVLQELPNHWQKCQDEQGIFYFNQATQQSSESMPPEVVAATLAATGYSSAQMLQQSFPGQQQMASQLAGVYPQQSQVASYQPAQKLQQSFPGQQQMASQLAGVYPQQSQVASYQQVSKPQNIAYQQAKAQQQPLQQISQQFSGMGNYAVPSVNYAAPAAATSAGGARQKLGFGEWVVYEDQMGDFFVHSPTGRQFEKPPEEMVRSYQAHKAAGLING